MADHRHGLCRPTDRTVGADISSTHRSPNAACGVGWRGVAGFMPVNPTYKRRSSLSVLTVLYQYCTLRMCLCQPPPVPLCMFTSPPKVCYKTWTRPRPPTRTDHPWSVRFKRQRGLRRVPAAPSHGRRASGTRGHLVWRQPSCRRWPLQHLPMQLQAPGRNLQW